MLVTWKLRDRPLRLISNGRRPVMSSPLSRIAPGAHREAAGDQVEQRRLAGAVRADDRVALAARRSRATRRWMISVAPKLLCTSRELERGASCALACSSRCIAPQRARDAARDAQRKRDQPAGERAPRSAIHGAARRARRAPMPNERQRGARAVRRRAGRPISTSRSGRRARPAPAARRERVRPGAARREAAARGSAAICIRSSEAMPPGAYSTISRRTGPR